MTTRDAKRLNPGDMVCYHRDNRINHGQVVFSDHGILDIDWDDDSNSTIDLHHPEQDSLLPYIELSHKDKHAWAGVR